MAGLKTTVNKTRAAFPVLVDPEGKNTGRYRTDGFSTYLIDKEGKILKVLTGSKTKRPSADKIYNALRTALDPSK